MKNTVFPAPAQTLLPIDGTEDMFPVRRIFCVGRNYAEHAREMGNDPDREPPFFFTKPADAAVVSGLTLPFPMGTENLHHEAELVIAIGKAGRNIAPEDAEAHIYGYASGNDLTRRDLQADAKATRRPWDMSKGFDQSAIVGLIKPATDTGSMTAGRITCIVDGAVKQDSDLAEMIWPNDRIISFLSDLVELQPGDLIMTGTPAGVGEIKPGQTCSVKIEGLAPATVTYAA